MQISVEGLPKLKFQPEITWGNILTMVAMIAAIFWSYSEMTAEQRVQSNRTAALEVSMQARVALIEATIRERSANADADRTAKDARIRALETQASGFAADLRGIQAGIGRVERAIEQLSAKVAP